MRAKTKRNWLFNLLAILGVVFAFVTGVTYCAVSLTLNHSSTPLSTATYLAKQEYKVINDTLDTPIPFGQSANICDVSVQYSYSYNFDIRIAYNLVWVDANGNDSGLSTDNVILHFADRDNYIVDNDYIFYKDSITAGSGNLAIIVAIDFVDPTDSTYLGYSLKIDIDDEDIMIYKAQGSYSTTSDLIKDISDTESAKAWLWYRKDSTSSTTAYALVYNLRSTYANGVDHPNWTGAYSRTYTTEGGVTSVSSATWLGGNRAYAGIGMYVMTGNTPYTFKVKVTGVWSNGSTSTSDSQSSDSSSSAQIFVNNIRFNYGKDWTYSSKADDNVFEEYTYNYTIPENTAVYIEIADSIEIITPATIKGVDYSNYRVLANVNINDTALVANKFENSIASINKLGNASLENLGKYSKSSLSIINTTTYNPSLYRENLGSGQIYYANINLVNNSAANLSVTLTYSLNIYISNGSTASQYGEEYQDGTLKVSSEVWDRVTINASSGLIIKDQQMSTVTIIIAPYTAINLINEFALSIRDSLTSYKNTDAWVEIVVKASSSVTTNNSENVEIVTGTSGSNYVFLAKNNTDKTITGITPTLTAKQRTETYTSLGTRTPADWVSNYWDYYTKSGNNFIQNTSSTWVDNTYYQRSISYADYPVNLTESNSGSPITLQPGESIVLGTMAIPTNDNATTLIFNNSATCSTVKDSANVSIWFNGTEDAFIYNNTATNYYVKFDGKVSGTLDYIQTIGDNNYYLGVIRPGQIVHIPMETTAESITIAEAGTTYSLPSGWGTTDDAVDTMYKNFF